MPSVADALRQHAPECLQRFGQRVPIGQRKVLAAITRGSWAESTTSAAAVVASIGWVGRVAIAIARTVAMRSRRCG